MKKNSESKRQVVTGTGKLESSLVVTMGDQHVSPTTLFRTSQDFLKAAEKLDPSEAAAPFGLVAAQCLELALKSFLMKNVAMTEKELRTKISHDLRKAWTQCVKNGLDIDATMPRWAAYLHAGHHNPYLFRYNKTNTATVLASKAHVLDGLIGVMKLVQAASR